MADHSIRVRDLAFPRFKAPDLDTAEAFMTDFGMHTVDKTGGALYMRGTSDRHHVYVVEKGEPDFVGMAFIVDDEGDLDRLSKSPSASDVHQVDEPGGGKRVVLNDPDGFQIEVIYGMEKVAPLPVRTHPRYNTGSDKARLGDLQRVTIESPHIKRAGHCVINVTDYAASNSWYSDHFGLIPSDNLVIGEGEEAVCVASFMRCDQGKEHVDHHTLLCVGTGTAGFNHAAWECADIDDVMTGHDYMLSRGHTHAWGVGRHVLGSQVFDYWRDPWGRTVEFWTDGDLLSSDIPAANHDVTQALSSQWGPAAPPGFTD